MTDNTQFYTPVEVAEILKLNKFTIYEMIKRGELKAVKLNPKAWRIRREDLDAYIKSKEG
jgi:putative molybdopterin biosynthesis protein